MMSIGNTIVRAMAHTGNGTTVSRLGSIGGSVESMILDRYYNI